MSKVKSFSFYENYYAILKYLPDEDRLKLYDAIFNYMFEDIEPTFEGLMLGIWKNLKMPLDTSKNNAGRGGRKRVEKNRLETDEKPIRNRLKTEKKTNNISTFLFLISNFKKLDRGLLRGKIEEWFTYKDERKEIYKETGMKSLLTRLEKSVDKYGEQAVVDLIDECMSNNWKGIIFEKLKQENIPDWFSAENNTTEMSGDERLEFDSLLEGMI